MHNARTTDSIDHRPSRRQRGGAATSSGSDRSARFDRAGRVAGAAALACSLAFGLGGCYSPKGGAMPSAVGGFTYTSTETFGKSFTLVDVRTGEPVFSQVIPPGEQLTIRFLEGLGDDPVVTPDRMLYELQPIGTSTGRLRNQITVPPAGARRIDIDVTQDPRFRERPQDERYRVDSPEDRPDWWSPRGGQIPDERMRQPYDD